MVSDRADVRPTSGRVVLSYSDIPYVALAAVRSCRSGLPAVVLRARPTICPWSVWSVVTGQLRRTSCRHVTRRCRTWASCGIAWSAAFEIGRMRGSHWQVVWLADPIFSLPTTNTPLDRSWQSFVIRRQSADCVIACLYRRWWTPVGVSTIPVYLSR